ncbi:MAG: sulfatase, partial [Phycisphaerae bacterium]|nr:sulfatase [Phycisphaerae bacterium]
TAGLGGYAGTVHTPNQQRLAKMGVEFTRAYCASPVCCPSRAAVMTGLMPYTSGIYNNGQWWKPHMPDLVTIPMHFRAHGYSAAGAGKIFHHTAGNNPPSQWDEFQRLIFRDDPWYRGSKLNYPWSKVGPPPKGFPFSGVKNLPHENDWGSLPDKGEAQYDDAKTVDFAIEYLQRKHSKPFFLACGIFRPHLPWYAPKKYFDMYPLDKIKLPEIRDDDLDDIPPQGRALSKARRSDLEKITSAGKRVQAVQAYLASISFADAQFGRLLNALAKSPHVDNTIIVFWSDHGWHLGEKKHWHKMTLWEEATRVPFIIAAPGVSKPGGRCDRPVSLIDIYPTLIDLCGLKTKPELDGLSLADLLRDPSAKRTRPAVMAYRRGQFAVRWRQWRYIRYSDGGQELYDHDNDPNEWTNLANNAKYNAVIAELGRWIPKAPAANAPSKSAYSFDPETYSWVHKKTGKKIK